ncbi:ABC transporter ATP-binding protein [Archangium sp.]|jgi:ABC-2 type transport system ATP-binding protein|uniref:ABC transporter ATP-binding protein n=1 Tax=Archangium sp. TaxID=1872627 RepID=UPI002ED8115E
MGKPGSGEAGDLAIEVRNLVKHFGDLRVLEGIDLEARRGECVGLLGPNGAGKTTTVEILEGLQEPSGGTVRLFGKTWAEAPDELRSRLGIQLQETKFPERLTVKEVIELFQSFHGRGLPVDEAIALVKLEAKRDAQVQTLSGGQLQRLALAVALSSAPDLLFLDEPTTGLDPQSRRLIWDVVAQLKTQGCTIVLTTHYLEEAERLCDRLFIIDHGRVIVRGTPNELIAQLPGAQIIEFSTSPELPSERFSELPGLRELRTQAGVTSLSIDELHVAVPALMALVHRHEAHLVHLSTRRATLDDVFLSLTGRSLREGEPTKAAS